MSVHISSTMSIYSTPCLPNFDKETSGSEDSVYVTPEISFTDSVFNKYCSPVSCDECDRKLTKMPLLDSPVVVNNTRRKRKFKSDSVFDKENLKVPSRNIACHRKSDAGIPLKCVTTLFNTDQHLHDFQREKNLYSGFPEKRSIVPPIKKVDQRKITPIKSTQSSLFQRMKVMRKLKSRCDKLNQSEISSDTETTVIKIPTTKSCGSISFENSKDIKIPYDQSERKSARTFSFAVLKKCRLVQLKRILTRPVSSIRSCYVKYLQKFRGKHYQPLHPLPGEDGHNFMNVSKVQSENLIETSKKTPHSTANIQELLQTVISKLSSMEREMKELKILFEENKNRGTVACYPGPPPPPLPPPPPPLPPNIFNHGTTPKRKVDLTTPENQQLAKRPSRIQEQRGQFSVTVEDLKNVKLRKIGNPVSNRMNLGRNTIKEPMSLPLKRANASRFKRNSVVDQESSEKKADLFSPRSRSITTETTLMGSPETTTVTSLNLNIYEQTPKRTKCRGTLFPRRGDLLNDPST